MADWDKIPKEIREKMGAYKIEHGECPRGAFSPMVCMFCPYGHMTECHHPYTCEETECSHYLREMEEDPAYAYEDEVHE